MLLIGEELSHFLGSENVCFLVFMSFGASNERNYILNTHLDKSSEAWANLEGGRGSETPLENYKWL